MALATFLAGLVTAQAPAGAQSGAGFSDVDPDRFYADAVAWMVDNNITTGTSPTTFSPDRNVTRGEVATFLYRSAGSPAASSAGFSDVDPDRFYADAVAWMVDNNITTGTSPTTFSPDRNVTRGEVATFLYRSAGSPAASSAGFSDVDPDRFYADAVAWMVDNNITTGTSPTTFSPDRNVTRGEVATFLWRHQTGGGATVAEVVTDENTHVVAADEVQSAEASGDGAVVVVSDQDPIQAGDVIVLPPSDEFPSGHIGTVVSVSGPGGQQTIETEPAPVVAAFPAVEASGVTTPDPTLLAPEAIFTDRFRDELEAECGISVTDPAFNIDLGFGARDARLHYDMSWGPGRSDYIRLVAEWTSTAGIDVAIGLEGSCDVEFELGNEITLTRGFVPGTAIPWNVNVTPEATISLQGQATAINGSAGVEVIFRLGFEYRDGNVSVIRAADPTTSAEFDRRPSAGGNVSVMVGAAIDVEIGGKIAFGPVKASATGEVEFFIGASFDMTVDTNADPWWDVALRLKVIIEIEFEITAKLFGKGLETKIDHPIGELTLATIPIADAGGPYRGPRLATTSGDLPAGFVGTAIDSFRLSATGGDAPYEWEANGLPSGLRLSESGVLSGTPSRAGLATATITVTDAVGSSNSVGLTFEILPNQATFANKILRQGDGTSYFIDSNYVRHWIPNGGTYNCLVGWENRTVESATASQIANFPSGSDATCTPPSTGRNKVMRTADGTSYFIDNNYVRHWIPNGGTYNCLVSWGGKTKYPTNVTPIQIDSFANGSNATCTPPSTVRNKVIRQSNGTAYYIDNNYIRHWIPTGDVYNCLRYWSGFDLIDNITTDHVNSFASGSEAACSWPGAVNKILRQGDGTSYFIDSNYVRHWIPNGGTYNCLVGWENRTVESATASQIANFPSGSNATCTPPSTVRNKVMRTADGTSYFIDNNYVRHWIPNGGTYNCLVSWSGKAIYSTNATPSQVDSFANGAEATCTPTAARDTVIRKADGTAYYIDNNYIRHWIPNGGTYNCLRFVKGKPQHNNVSQTHVDSFAGGSNATCLALLSGPDGTGFYVDATGKRHWVPNGGIWECLDRRPGVTTHSYGNWNTINLFTEDSNWASC